MHYRQRYSSNDCFSVAPFKTRNDLYELVRKFVAGCRLAVSRKEAAEREKQEGKRGAVKLTPQSFFVIKKTVQKLYKMKISEFESKKGTHVFLRRCLFLHGTERET